MTEMQLAETLVELADTLVDDFDVIEFLHVLTERCVDVLGVDACGLLLADQRGGALQVAAASTAATHTLELLQLQADEGPCVDCFRTGQAVSVPDLRATTDHWPRFTPAAVEAGYAAVYAIPMRLRAEVIGALNLFDGTAHAIGEDRLRMARAMADVATIGLLQERVARRREVLVEQLQTALNSRLIIEQAKGVVAERDQMDVDQAFVWLRNTARSRNQRLSELSRDVVEHRGGSLSAAPGVPPGHG